MKADDTQRSNFLSFLMFCVVKKKKMKKKEKRMKKKMKKKRKKKMKKKKRVEVNDAAFGLHDAP